MCLPEGMDELFEIVRFERTDAAYDIWLDEKKKLSDEATAIRTLWHVDTRITLRSRTIRCAADLCIFTCARTNGGTRIPTRSSVTISNYPMRKGHDSAPSSWLF